jgi:hypothetical protein
MIYAEAYYGGALGTLATPYPQLGTLATPYPQLGTLAIPYPQLGTGSYNPNPSLTQQRRPKKPRIFIWLGLSWLFRFGVAGYTLIGHLAYMVL